MRKYVAPLAGIMLVAAVAAGVFVARPASPPPAPAAASSIEEKLARALARGVEYLLRAQSEDGAWRSDTYGTFKDGTALTPLALNAVQEAEPPDTDPRQRASRFLSEMVRSDGTVDESPIGLDFPVYTASLTVQALSREEAGEFRTSRDAWLKFLLDRQLTERTGWSPTDDAHGGWGYCRTIPHKPVAGQLAPPLVESNLSATVFALDALNAAGHTDTRPLTAARQYILRRQNADGGFHFIAGDPIRNKARATGTDWNSYGSTTADGTRGLLRTGGDPSSGRDWLVANFRPDVHPGPYAPSHEANRDAVYFYYAASASQTLCELKVVEAGGSEWAPRLAEALVVRQQADGSWKNPVSLVREDDPIAATSWAVRALVNCKKTMQRK